MSHTGPVTAVVSFTCPVLLQEVTVKAQPLPVVLGSVLAAVSVTVPKLLAVVAVVLVPVTMGQLLAVLRDVHLPAIDTPPTLARL